MASSASPTIDDRTVRDVAAKLRLGHETVLLVGGEGLTERGLLAAGRIAKATGARLFSPTSNTRIQRGVGRVALPSIPYPLQGAIEALKGTENLVLAGAHRPVAYFAYPGKPAMPTPDGCQIHTLARHEEDVVDALERVADELGAPRAVELISATEQGQVPNGAISAESFAAVIAARLPDQAIVVDEALTSGRGLLAATRAAPTHDWLQLTGGAIGIGLPLATGAAVACPDRPVICLQADGSGMYTLQSLWRV